MGKEHFSFGTEPRMKAVPEGTIAELKFSGAISTKETEWGEKYTFEITLYSHPSYESIPKEGIKTNWESKSQLAEQLFNATSPEAIEKNPSLAKAIKNDRWELARSEEGTYFINNKLTGDKH